MPSTPDSPRRPHARTAHRARHASSRQAQARASLLLGGLSAALVLAVGLTGLTVANGLGTRSSDTSADISADTGADADALARAGVRSAAATALQLAEESAQPTAAAIVPICDRPAVQAALAGGTDAEVIAAAGGPTEFRSAVWAGEAPCIALDDPARSWVVVNKARPFVPLDYTPTELVVPEGVRSLRGHELRSDAATALGALSQASLAAGAGEIALLSGYRSYGIQVSLYARHAAERGAAGADLVSAHAGFSEHQSGLTGDLVACNPGCGSIDDLAATAQGAWLREHAWEYGWITRYEDGHTETTGYKPEPWHLRYIGVELASAYHYGGFHTLEEFFGLAPAPVYLG